MEFPELGLVLFAGESLFLQAHDVSVAGNQEAAQVGDVFGQGDGAVRILSRMTDRVEFQRIVALNELFLLIFEGHFVGHGPPVPHAAQGIVLGAFRVEGVGDFMRHGNGHAIEIGLGIIGPDQRRKHQRRQDHDSVVFPLIHGVDQGEVGQQQFARRREAVARNIVAETVVGADEMLVEQRLGDHQFMHGLQEGVALTDIRQAVLIPVVRGAHAEGHFLQLVQSGGLGRLAHPVQVLDTDPVGVTHPFHHIRELLLQFGLDILDRQTVGNQIVEIPAGILPNLIRRQGARSQAGIHFLADIRVQLFPGARHNGIQRLQRQGAHDVHDGDGVVIVIEGLGIHPHPFDNQLQISLDGLGHLSKSVLVDRDGRNGQQADHQSVLEIIEERYTDGRDTVRDHPTDHTQALFPRIRLGIFGHEGHQIGRRRIGVLIEFVAELEETLQRRILVFDGFHHGVDGDGLVVHAADGARGRRGRLGIPPAIAILPEIVAGIGRRIPVLFDRERHRIRRRLRIGFLLAGNRHTQCAAHRCQHHKLSAHIYL